MWLRPFVDGGGGHACAHIPDPTDHSPTYFARRGLPLGGASSSCPPLLRVTSCSSDQFEARSLAQ
eukprot:2223921-Pyramimonas_sp.AAC.1